MSESDQIRNKVSEAYARAVSGPEPSSCCGGAQTVASSCCAGPDPSSIAAQVAGYSPDELASVPYDAVTSSFGCGNPLAFSGVQAGEVVLDLGSGAGIDILLAASKVGPDGRVIGVDMTDEMIARARQNIATSGFQNVEVRKGIIEQLPVDDASVDWVISNCVINLSPEKDRVFAEIARALKPGGRISISDIVVQGLPQWALQSETLYSSCVAGAISEEAYLAGLRRAGLEQVEVTERLVYDATQIEAFILDGDDAVAAAAAEAGGVKQVAANLAGKIWSAKFTGRKPA